jgi:carbon-monoxide dehydrogenase medium subunit
MHRFDLLEPNSFEAACAILAGDGEARPIAGGTALLTVIKQGLLLPRTLVNLYKIQESREITYDLELGLSIGALASIYDLETSPLIRQYYPVLAEACHVVANVRIRNMATIGGNLAHGDYQSDPPTVLTALDARVELLTAHGKRQLDLSDFLLGSYETALEPGELVAGVRIPPMPPGTRGVYIKFTTGSSEERPCAGVVALVDGESGICRELRLAIGAVSPKPLRIDAGEEMAKNKELNPELIDRIAAEAARAVDPIDDLRGPAEYKRHLVRVLTRRAIRNCLGGGQAELRS